MENSWNKRFFPNGERLFIGEKKVVSGSRIKKVLEAAGDNFLSMERKYKLPEARFRNAANYCGYLLDFDIAKFCEIYGIDEESLKPTDEEVAMFNEKFGRRRKDNSVRSAEYRSKKQSGPSFLCSDEPTSLKGLFRYCSEQSIDVWLLSELTGIATDRIVMIFAGHKAEPCEISGIAKALRLNEYYRSRIFNAPRFSSREVTKEEEKEIGLYAASLYAENKNASIIGIWYFWERACYSDYSKDKIELHRMPDWVQECAIVAKRRYVESRKARKSELLALKTPSLKQL